MKKFKLLFLLTVIGNVILSQTTYVPYILQDGSFEKIGGSGNCQPGNAINCSLTVPNLCMLNWSPSHGTPQIFTGPTTDVPNGTHYCYMWAQYIGGNTQVVHGEGVFASFTFLAGATYQISMMIRCPAQIPTGATFQVAASNTLLPNVTNNNNCYNIPIPPNPTVSIQTITSFSSTWQQYNFTFTPTITYNQFWIYPLVPTLSGQTWGTQFDVHVDRICIQGLRPTCNPTLVYSSGTIPVTGYPNSRQAWEIQIGTSYAGNNSGFVESSNTDWTHLTGGGYVDIKPNFKTNVSYSGAFQASILACSEDATNCFLRHGRIEVYDTYPNNPNNPDTIPDNSDFVNGVFPGNDLYNPSESHGFFELGNKKDYESESETNGKIPSQSLASKFSIYPNPAKGMIWINTNESVKINSVDIISSNGIRMAHILMGKKQSTYNVNINKFDPGFYIIRLFTDEGTVVKKISIYRD